MKILVFLPRKLGASLFSFPALRALKTNFPAARITIATSEFLAGLLTELLPDFSILTIPEIKDIKKLKSATKLIARQEFNLAILMDDSFAAALVVYLARIPERWGYDRENRGFMLTRSVRLKFTDPTPHLTDYYLNLLKKNGLQVQESKTALSIPEESIKEARRRLDQSGISSDDNLIIIKPGSSYGLSRVWPFNHQTELIKKLSGLPAQILLVGSSASQSVCEKIASNTKGRVHNLAGSWPLENMPGLLSLGRVFIGNDGGLTHLANFMGVPVIALYGPVDPKICGPVLPPFHVFQHPSPCSPCLYKNCPYDHRCLNEIHPDDVFKKVVEFFEFTS